MTCVKSCGVALVWYLAAAGLCPAQTPPIFNVVNYGATGNGTTLDSPAINAAIAAAGAAGGGTVTFPPGTYLCGSIHLTNCQANLTLYLSNNAVIWGSAPDIDVHETSAYGSYQDQGHTWFHDALIWGQNLNNFTIAGPGKIDGHGALTTGNPSGSNPGDKALCLVLCSNVTITGITITNGGHFGILAQACTNMMVSNARIWEKTSRDGFNLIDSSYVVVTNCDIEGSDDSMCLKSTYALGRKIGGHNIRIVDCTILSTQNNATQIGSETVGDFSDITWSNLQLTAAGKAGIGITSQDGSQIDGMTYDNITISNCACPIFLKLDYRTTDTPNPAVGAIRNISINNVVAVHSAFDNRTNTSTINGYFNTGNGTNVEIENITFNNVNVSNDGRRPAGDLTNNPAENQDWQPQNFGKWPSYGWYLRWARNISFTNCQAHFDHNDDRPAVVANFVTNVLFNNFTADVGADNTNYDLGFLVVSNYQAVSAVASANAPSPGAALRVFNSNSVSAQIVSPPYFNPGDGLYSYGQTLLVAISSTTPGATIRYTTDGTTPTSSSGTIYSGPVTINLETVLRAIAYTNGMVDSAVNTAIYNFINTAPVTAAPTFNPPGGIYAAGQTVTISSATPGASIYYTTDGSTPATNHGTLYSTPVAINASTTLQAMAAASNLLDSAVSIAGYTITGVAGTPAFNPPAGNYIGAQSVVISTATEDAAIRYTTDGSTPTPTTGTLYSGPVAVNTNATLNAIAFAAGAGNSSVSTAVYTIVIPQIPPVTNFFFEAESIPFVTNGAVVVIQNDANSSGGHWMALEAAATGPYIEYTLSNVPAGTYQLNLKYKGNTERGIITHAVDGVPLGDSLDQYSASQTYPEISLGSFTFTNNGNHTVRQTVIGKNPANTSQPWASADRFALLLLQPPQPVFSNTVVYGNGVFQFGGSGYPTLPYRVLATTSLGSTNWTTIGAVSAGTNGALVFTDPNATNQPAEFYRLVTP